MLVDRSVEHAARNAALLAVVMGGLTTSGQAGLPCSYDVTIIEAGDCPPFGPQATIGTAVNDLGQIAGYYCQCFCGNGDEAFFWDGSTFTTLARPPGFRAARAYGMNDQGWIVGSMTEANIDLNHAVLWQNGQPIDLGIPPGGNFSEGLAVNSAGQAIGYWGNSVIGPIHGFVWQDGVMTDLGATLGAESSRATAISDAGTAVGWLRENTGDERTGYYVEDARVVLLGPIPGGLSSEASAINEVGQIAGHGKLDSGGSLVLHAFLFNDGVMTDLGTLPGTTFSRPTDINDSQQIVGFCNNALLTDLTPFIWQDGVMTDLNQLIPSKLNLTFEIAWAINNKGEIAGDANSAQGVVAVLLSPVGASPADINIDGVVNVLDLIELLLCFGQPATPPCDAPDTNQDGVVNVLDLINLLLDFGVTCHKQ